MEGIIVVNKPNGMTSHDVVQRVRKHFKIKRVGHAGTLDPLATGVLILLVGKATKLFDKFAQFDKAYRATLILGKKTDTADTQGKVIEEGDYEGMTDKAIKDAFGKYRGEIEQLPPMYSAVKYKGKKLYEWARKGIEVPREPRKISINELRIEEIDLPYVRFYLECSKGTYVRQLAEDIGTALGCGACISQIERTKVGAFSIEDAVDINHLDESNIQNWRS